VPLAGPTEFGLLPAEPALRPGHLQALPGPQPREVPLDSATIARAMNSNFPTGSVGSCTEPPMLMLSFTSLRVSSSAMSRASGTDRANRSSFLTTNVSPARHAAKASRKPGQ
jgi:hypothetical protein